MFWFVIDFNIGCSFVDLGGPCGPGRPSLPSKLWGPKRPTSWKVKLARRGRRDPQKINEVKAESEIYNKPKNESIIEHVIILG